MSFRDRTGTHRAWQLQPIPHDDQGVDSWTVLASQFVAALGGKDAATLVAQREGDTLASWVVTRQSAADDDAVAALAQAVSAKPVTFETVPSLPTGALAEVRVDPGASAGRGSSQHNAGIGQIAEAFRIALRDGETVAVSVRQPSKREYRKVTDWHRRRREHTNAYAPATHYSTESHTALARIVVCAPDRSRVRSTLNQFVAAIPGMDLKADARRVRRWPTALAVAAVAAAAILVWAAVALRWIPDPAGGWIDQRWPDVADMALLAVAAVALTMVVLLYAGWWPSHYRHVRFELSRGWLDAPRKPRRWWTPLVRVIGWLVPSPQSRNDPRRPAAPGRYPLAGDVVQLGAGMIAPMVSPHGGAAAGAHVTRQSDAPPVLLEPIGPAIGTSGGGLVHIPAANAYEGAGFVGAPGSGKTQIVRSLYGWHCHQRQHPTQLRGWPGEQSTLIAFESKNAAEADIYRQWASSADDEAFLFDVADPDSWVIDIFAHPVGDGTLRAKAAGFVDAMVASFAEGDIQGRSREALLMAFTGAVVAAATPQIAHAAGTGGSHPIQLAHLLLGSNGDQQAARLAGALIEHAIDHPDDTDAAAADEALQPFYGKGVTGQQRRQLIEAARNKLAQLTELDVWWQPGRTAVTFDQILTGHKAIVINTGTSMHGQLVSEAANRLLTSLLAWYLKDAIKRLCAGWQADGRGVVIFSDELSQLAGSSGEVLTWLREQGRVYGVRLFFATQHLDQLDTQVQRSFTGFGTMLWFRQNQPGAAEMAAKDLSISGGQWTPTDVAGLADYEVLLRTSVDGRRQPPVPVALTEWEADMGGFAAAQHLHTTPPPATADRHRPR